MPLAIPDISDYPIIARNILDTRVVTPAEIAGRTGGLINYSAAQQEFYRETLPKKAILEQMEKDGCILVPGPPGERSLADMHTMIPNHLHVDHGSWFLTEKFAKSEKIGSGWIALRTEPIPGSVGQDLEYAIYEAMKEPRNAIPKIATVSWPASVFRLVRNELLFRGVAVATSSVSSNRNFVTYSTAPNGDTIISQWDGTANPHIGLAGTYSAAFLKT